MKLQVVKVVNNRAERTEHTQIAEHGHPVMLEAQSKYILLFKLYKLKSHKFIFWFQKS